jgi:hypothetical protein
MFHSTWTRVLILILLLCSAGTAGCASVRTADTHNTTIAVQDYNAWIARQQTVDRDVTGAVTRIGDHVTAYNTGIASDRPDLALLRDNLAKDRQSLDLWGTDLTALSAAIDRFEQNTTALTYDNASARQTKEILGQMTRYMRACTIERENARQHLIEYVDNALAYIAPDDPDYWNEQYRKDAMEAKAGAGQSLVNGDLALQNLTTQAVHLESLQ